MIVESTEWWLVPLHTLDVHLQSDDPPKRYACMHEHTFIHKHKLHDTYITHNTQYIHTTLLFFPVGSNWLTSFSSDPQKPRLSGFKSLCMTHLYPMQSNAIQHKKRRRKKKCAHIEQSRLTGQKSNDAGATRQGDTRWGNVSEPGQGMWSPAALLAVAPHTIVYCSTVEDSTG